MEMACYVISWIFISLGIFFVLVGAFGLLTFPDFYTRVHAVSVTDTLGLITIMLGLVIQTFWLPGGWTGGGWLVTAKLGCLTLLLLFTSPMSSHALVQSAWLDGVKPYTNGGSSTASDVKQPEGN